MATGSLLGEIERLAALRSYEILDSGAETSFDDLADLAAQIADTPISAITLVDRERVYVKASVGLDLIEVARRDSVCSHAILAPEQPMVVRDLAVDSRFADNPFVASEGGMRFYAGVPLISPQGHALGALCVLDHTPRDLSDAQRVGLSKLAAAVMTTLEFRRMMISMRQMAFTDPLTGLLNRTALLDSLQGAITRLDEDGAPFAVLYFDLDGFKTLNDTLGHAAGDAVLRVVAEMVTSVAQPGEVASRLGGDEFAIVVPAAETDWAHLYQRVRAAIIAGLRAGEWPVTLSMGAVLFAHAPESPAHALSVADAAMYDAKRGGRDRVTAVEYTGRLAHAMSATARC